MIRSKTKAAILAVFFNDPDSEYYLRQLERLTGYSIGNVRREMVKMESDGLLSARPVGKMRFYRLNRAYPLFKEMKGIVAKTIGMKAGLKKILSDLPGVTFSFIYGSFAEDGAGPSSDIDVVIIGDINPKDVKSLLFDYQVNIGRELNSIVYSKKEFLEKVRGGNHFIMSIVGGKKIFLKGSKDEFRRFIQIRKTRKT